MRLLDLPVELQLMIGDELDANRDLNAVSRTCRDLNNIFSPLLYKRDARRKKSLALIWAARQGRIGTLKKSLDAGAEPNIKTSGGDFFQKIIPHGYSWNTQPKTSIEIATYWGRQAAAIFLMERGASLQLSNCFSSETNCRCNLLHLACQLGYTELAKALIDSGMDVDIQGCYDRSPLQQMILRAAFHRDWKVRHHKHADVTKLLLENGADTESELQGSKNISSCLEKEIARIKILVAEGDRHSFDAYSRREFNRDITELCNIQHTLLSHRSENERERIEKRRGSTIG